MYETLLVFVSLSQFANKQRKSSKIYLNFIWCWKYYFLFFQFFVISKVKEEKIGNFDFLFATTFDMRTLIVKLIRFQWQKNRKKNIERYHTFKWTSTISICPYVCMYVRLIAFSGSDTSCRRFLGNKQYRTDIVLLHKSKIAELV